MSTSIKLALATLTLSVFLATAPVAYSMDAAAEASVVELESGAKVKVSGEDVTVLNADGSETPAPDGNHKAKDGSTITTKGGKIVK